MRTRTLLTIGKAITLGCAGMGSSSKGTAASGGRASTSGASTGGTGGELVLRAAGRAMPFVRRLALALIGASLACGPVNGSPGVYAPDPAAVPPGLQGANVVALARLNRLSPSATLCVRLSDETIRCGALDGTLPYAPVSLDGTTGLTAFDEAPSGSVWGDATWGGDGGRSALCGATDAGTLSCAMLEPSADCWQGPGPCTLEVTGAPTPLDQLANAQQNSEGAAVCTAFPDGGSGCAWNADDILYWVNTKVPGACLLGADEQVRCWAPPAVAPDAGGTTVFVENDPRGAQTIPGLDPAVQISLADATATATSAGCAVTASQSVECWGGAPALGLGGASGDAVAVQDSQTGKPLAGAASVAAAATHACAALEDGTVECWGSSGLFVAGHDPSESDFGLSASAVKVPGVNGAVAVVVGDLDTALGGIDCALQSNGQVLCWGSFTEVKPPTGNQAGAAVGEGLGSLLNGAGIHFCPCGPGD